ncbi:hypothetical protein NEOKW01_0533 [Nematocida sp. AWRm80]|nr:hypothetical protein NEOKW01_0533 [Nematocida sp. AWRm80]
MRNTYSYNNEIYRDYDRNIPSPHRSTRRDSAGSVRSNSRQSIDAIYLDTPYSNDIDNEYVPMNRYNRPDSRYQEDVEYDQIDQCVWTDEIEQEYNEYCLPVLVVLSHIGLFLLERLFLELTNVNSIPILVYNIVFGGICGIYCIYLLYKISNILIATADANQKRLDRQKREGKRDRSVYVHTTMLFIFMIAGYVSIPKYITPTIDLSMFWKNILNWYWSSQAKILSGHIPQAIVYSWSVVTIGLSVFYNLGLLFALITKASENIKICLRGMLLIGVILSGLQLMLKPLIGVLTYNYLIEETILTKHISMFWLYTSITGFLTMVCARRIHTKYQPKTTGILDYYTRRTTIKQRSQSRLDIPDSEEVYILKLYIFQFKFLARLVLGLALIILVCLGFYRLLASDAIKSIVEFIMSLMAMISPKRTV